MFPFSSNYRITVDYSAHGTYSGNVVHGTLVFDVKNGVSSIVSYSGSVDARLSDKDTIARAQCYVKSVVKL